MNQLQQIVADTLRDNVTLHKRRCAIKQGEREPNTAGCDHAAWNPFKRWCDACGITAEEIYFAMGEIRT